MTVTRNINNQVVWYMILVFTVGLVIGSVVTQVTLPIPSNNPNLNSPDITGTYYNNANGKEYITIYPDMTFFYHGKTDGDTNTGTVTRQGTDLIFTATQLGSEKFIIQSDKSLKDTAGDVWIKK
jgi:hypothetical protein